MYSRFLLICTVVLMGQEINSTTKLNVDILYESLCPDSYKFITQQLYPVWKELSPYVNLKLIPFGKSGSLDGKEYFCQHGPDECKGNRLQSCALDVIQDQNGQVEFVNCFMRVFGENRYESGRSCLDDVGVNFTDVTECTSSEKGNALQLEAQRDTLRILPKFVPTILYNGEFNQAAQDASLRDFRGVVCFFITQLDSKACSTSPVSNI